LKAGTNNEKKQSVNTKRKPHYLPILVVLGDQESQEQSSWICSRSVLPGNRFRVNYASSIL